MSRHVGVVRDAAGLARAREEIENIAAELRKGSARETQPSDATSRREFWELRNLVDAARAVIAAAAHRRESRGAHYRADFPQPDPSLDGQHSLGESTEGKHSLGRTELSNAIHSRARRIECTPSSGILAGRRTQLLDFASQVVDVLKLAVDRGEADVGDLVERLQLAQHASPIALEGTSAVPRARSLASTRARMASIASSPTGRFVSPPAASGAA